MPSKNLIALFNASFSEAQKQIPEKAPIDTFVHQTTYFFPSPPTLAFVSSHEQEAIRYSDLPEFVFTKEQQELITAEEKRLTMQAQVSGQLFYNGNHMAVTGVHYDESANKLMIAAYRCSYVVLMCLSKGALPVPEGLSLYKTGVLSPFLTIDRHTAFMERNDKSKDAYNKDPRISPPMKHNLFSVASGFLEPHEGLNTLLADIVTATGQQEATQEFAIPPIKTITPLCGLSIRKTIVNKAPGAVEFIVPITLPWNRSQLEQMLRNNTARDAQEHTGQFQILPIADEVTFNAFCDQFPGAFLCKPCMQVLNRYSESLLCSIKPEQTDLPPIRFSPTFRNEDAQSTSSTIAVASKIEPKLNS